MSVWLRFTVHEEQKTDDCSVQHSHIFFFFNKLYVNQPLLAQKQCLSFITRPIPQSWWNASNLYFLAEAYLKDQHEQRLK